MNTMADEGTARQHDGGEILEGVPSFHLSWEAYNAKSTQGLLNMYDQQEKYTAYFSYVMLDAGSKAVHIENGYADTYNYTFGDKYAHANHSIYVKHDFVDHEFGAHSLDRQEFADKFVANADIDTSEEQAIEALRSKPLWKGRGELMGTVTSTYFAVDGKKVDMAIYTDEQHEPVRIRNY